MEKPYLLTLPPLFSNSSATSYRVNHYDRSGKIDNENKIVGIILCKEKN
jgi:hypothetical protein